VDQPAARAIDQPQIFLGQLETVGVDDVAGLFGQRRVQRDEIGPPQQLFEIDLFDPEIDRALVGEERIVGDHLHLHAERTVGDDRADIAAADDAERLAENLDAEKFVLFPFAGSGRGIRFGNLPRQLQHKGDRVLGGGDRIAERRVHHDDATRGRRRDVDIVDADAGAADYFQVAGAFEDFRRYLGGGADGQPVKTVDRFGELVLVLAEIGLKVGLDAAVLEDRYGGGRQRVGDENFGHERVLWVLWPSAESWQLRRLRQRILGLGVGPVEPECERFDIGVLDGRT